MSHREIIEGLSERIGSQSLLAAKLGVDRTRLPKWKNVGIPPSHWPALLKLAKRYRYRLSLDKIDRCSPARSNANPPPAA